MAKLLFLCLVPVVIALGGTGSARAATVAAELSCAFASGDIWGEGEPDIPRREIDGGQIKSLSDFGRMAGRREPGVIIVKGGNFSGWDFSAAPLSGICFEESKLAGANFANAFASGVGFIKADLTGANMAGARMPGILFRNAGLKNVMAKDANFSNGHFDGGWFEGKVEGWNIDDANMTGFVFDCGITVPDGCPVYQGGAAISAKGTDFTLATLHSFGVHNMILSGAILEQTIIGPAQLPDLAEAEFRGDIILRGGGSNVRLSANEAQKLIAENTRQKAVEANPSFDCTKAASKVEQEICGEYAGDLRSADRDIVSLYKRAKRDNLSVVASQRAWLKQRNLCGKVEYPSDCIRESYSIRKGELLGLIGENAWLAPGESALFIDHVLPLPNGSVRPDLLVKLTPALVGASMTEILIERGKDGFYAIKGSAVGANAHLCSIDASHLYLDRETGWYVPVSESAAIPIFRTLDDRLEIFAGGQPDYEKYPEASNFMSCGMRARFSETVRVDVSDAVIESYRKSLNEEM